MLRVKSLALVLMLALTATTSLAHADAPPKPDCLEMPCSVIRSCSSTGIACQPDDRACAEGARANGLEVRCEQQCSDSRRLVYCPPDAGRGDSKVVWLLLTMAVSLAVGGSAILWAILRKERP